MRELIYAGKNVEQLIRKEFPTVKIVDASDIVHRERFEIELDVEKKKFYHFAIRNGFAGACFVFLCKLMNKDKEIESWVKEAKNNEEVKENVFKLQRRGNSEG